MYYKILIVFFLCFCLVPSSFAASPYYDTFSDSQISLTKWQYCQNGEIRGGQLWLDLYGENSWLSNRCYVVEENITNYLSSFVSISKNSNASPGASVAVKLVGIFYNDTFDGTSGYNDWEGNILSDVRLQLYMGEIRARAVVVRYNNSTGSSKTPSSAFFTQPINFDTQYLLSIKLVGSKIVFKCNDETIVYSIKTPIYPTNEPRSLLTAIIYADMGEQGYVGGFFDNVCLAETCYQTAFLPSVYELLLKSKE